MSTADGNADGTLGVTAGVSDSRRAWLLVVLTATISLSYVDRYLLAVLIQPIKLEFGLSDSQIGLLTGLAFVVFYVLLGLPISRLADKGYRRAVMVGSIGVWSAMTAITGAATSFWHLAAARFGVGAGEAGVLPTAQAVVSDLYAPRQRTLALAILSSGGSIGLLLAFAGGALFEAALGWRLTFMVMLIPGMILGAVIFMMLPRQIIRGTPGDAQAVSSQPLKQLLANPHFRHLPFAQGAIAFLMFGHVQWLPAFFERSFGVARVEVGVALGFLQAGGTLAGALVGAYAMQKFVDQDRKRLSVAMACIAVGGIAVLSLYAAPNAAIGYALAAISGFLLSAPSGLILAHMQTSVHASQRATAAAAAIMAASIIGLGAGPLAIGMLSDALKPSAGIESLRYGALIAIVVAIPWAIFHLARLRRIPRWEDGRAVN
ncbi:MFS transporter [Pseudoxanthomonas jiangsuensis]|uniref:MFS transporter n=1 Tax=Pseudoxanthomonas jiangsuensis TaxID=619688 RepID=UPI00139085ED|nr:MFS transporter [Pseudoxanthomonas jiangsuensis]